MGFSVMPGFNPLFHSLLFVSDALFFFLFFFCVCKFRCIHACKVIHTMHACSILFKMTAITTSSISIRTAVMIAKLAMNQTATVRVMQLGIMFVS